MVGSYGYLAPERLRGEAATPESDLCALGCLLVTSITGQLPYPGTDMQVAQQHLSSPIPQWDETTPVLAKLNDIVRLALAKTPAERYHNVREMRADLHTARQLASDLERVTVHTVRRTRLPSVLAATEAPTPIDVEPTGARKVKLAVTSGVVGPGGSGRRGELGRELQRHPEWARFSRARESDGAAIRCTCHGIQGRHTEPSSS